MRPFRMAMLLAALGAGWCRAPVCAQGLPPEHPPIQPSGMPPDHPGMQPAPTAMPQGMPQDLAHMMAAGPKGTLAVRAIQGTVNGPKVGSDEVELYLVHRGQAVKQIKTRLDENGMVMIDDVPVGIGVQPVVRIKHAGVLYQEAGPMMDAATPRASMNVTVYEVTDEQPKWKVVQRQVMAARLPTEMDVVEVVTVENEGDRTWLGRPANEEGRRDTVVLGLPEKAEQFNLENGFHGWCCTSYADGGLHVQMPLMPGRMTYRFSYIVPIVEGSADLRFSSVVATDMATVVVPDDGAGLEAAAVEPAGTENVQGARVRRFNAARVEAGKPVGVLLTGMGSAAAVSGPAPEAAKGLPVWVMTGAGVAVVACLGLIGWRRAQKRAV